MLKPSNLVLSIILTHSLCLVHTFWGHTVFVKPSKAIFQAFAYVFNHLRGYLDFQTDLLPSHHMAMEAYIKPQPAHYPP